MYEYIYIDMYICIHIHAYIHIYNVENKINCLWRIFSCPQNKHWRRASFLSVHNTQALWLLYRNLTTNCQQMEIIFDFQIALSPICKSVKRKMLSIATEDIEFNSSCFRYKKKVLEF